MSGVYEGALVKSVSVENMLNQRDAVMQRIRQALDILTEAGEIARAAHIGFPRFKFETTRYGTCLLDHERNDETQSYILREVDRTAWQFLMSESGLRTFMDAQARRAWDEGLEKKVPEFTLNNVAATFKGLFTARGEMFERGVVKVFRSLSWNYKTNQPFKFGTRIVVRCRAYGSFDYTRCDELEDLQRVLCILDGKPEEDHRDGLYQRLRKAEQGEAPFSRKQQGTHDDIYMFIRWFKNGNAHVTFKRPDLVDRMNKIVAKHYPGALPHDQHAEAA